jgi:serine/threonine protein kinase
MSETDNRKLFKDKTKNLVYVKGKLLGTGGFAKCYEAISSADGRLCAAKVIPKKSIN